MIRMFKALGIGLLAALSIGAVMSSAASAAEQGKLTSTGPVTLTGADVTGTRSTLTFTPGQTVDCEASYTGHKFNQTPHTFIPVPATTVTLKPTYKNCIAHIGETTAPETVTVPAGCDFVLHIGNTIVPNPEWGTTMDVECGAGEAIIVHAYTSSAHTTSICTIEVGTQTGLSGARVKNLAGGKITLGGTITGITAKRTGILCGGTETSTTATESLDVEVSAKNEGGTATEISISD